MNYLINQPDNTIRISPELKNGAYIIKIKSGDNAWYGRIIQY
jgi:hypothetical protein